MKEVISKNLFIVSLLHLLVDFTSAGSVVTSYFVYGPNYLNIAYIFLIYNCFAFLLQPFFGLLVDNFKEDKLKVMLKAFLLISIGTLLLGFTLTLFAISFFSFKNFITLCFASALLGCGNALFHVVGGKEALLMSDKATPGGIFVSFGSVGVGLSTIMFASKISNFIKFSYFYISPILLIILSLLYMFSKESHEAPIYRSFKKNKTSIFITIVVILCLAIAVRSFLGFYSKMSLDISEASAIFLLSFAAFIGKAIGGIILDLAGPYFLIGVSTILTTILSIFLRISYVDYIFVIGFNLLMPLTLDALRKCFVNKEGFAFGLAASFLVPGYLLGGISKNYGNQALIISIISFLTGISLLVVYILNRKQLNERDN